MIRWLGRLGRLSLAPAMILALGLVLVLDYLTPRRWRDWAGALGRRLNRRATP